MIEANFEYSHEFIKELNTRTMKSYNLIGQIALFLIFCGACIMFSVARNVVLGVFAAISFVVFLVGLVIANKSIERSNFGLLGQKVNVMFDKNEISIAVKLSNKTLYTANFGYAEIKSIKVKDWLMYIKIDKHSTIIIPKSGFESEENFVKALEQVSNN